MNPHHSSDGVPLDRRLIDAALERLSVQPPSELSMRRVAHDLGVSHQAPYVHFGSKKSFLAAVAGVGLQRAAEEAAATVAAAGEQPLARLHALAAAYLSFIRTRPHVHDLAYGPVVAKRDHALLQRAAIAYWRLLRETVAACQPPGTSASDVQRRAAVTWGAVYGIARLATFEQIPPTVPAGEDELIHAALDWLYDGWQAGSS